MNSTAEMLNATPDEKKQIIALQTRLFDSVKTMQELTDVVQKVYGSGHTTHAQIMAAITEILKTKSSSA